MTGEVVCAGCGWPLCEAGRSCAEVWRESRTSCSEDITAGDTLGSLTMMMTMTMTLLSLVMTMPGTCCGV